MVKKYSFFSADTVEETSPIEDECGQWVSYYDYADLEAQVRHLEVYPGRCERLEIENATLQVENERLKSEAGCTAADIATTSADGFREVMRSVDLEKFRVLAQGAVDTLTQNKTFPVDLAVAAGNMRHLISLIDAHKEGL